MYVPGRLSLRAGESIRSLLAGEGALDDHVLQGRHVNVGVQTQSHIERLVSLVDDYHIPLQGVGCGGIKKRSQNKVIMQYATAHLSK